MAWPRRCLAHPLWDPWAAAVLSAEHAAGVVPCLCHWCCLLPSAPHFNLTSWMPVPVHAIRLESCFSLRLFFKIQNFPEFQVVKFGCLEHHSESRLWLRGPWGRVLGGAWGGAGLSLSGRGSRCSALGVPGVQRCAKGPCPNVTRTASALICTLYLESPSSSLLLGSWSFLFFSSFV